MPVLAIPTFLVLVLAGAGPLVVRSGAVFTRIGHDDRGAGRENANDCNGNDGQSL
jgi:hypothetical protein